MKLNIEKEVAAMRRMTVNELRARYAEIFGESTGARNKQWLVKRMVWKMQAMAEGDITERARHRAAELARDADLRTTMPRTSEPASPARVVSVVSTASASARLPMPGAVLVRQYKGETLEVRVLPNGFQYEGEIYKSLSAVAKKITGQHCSGYHFFRLRRPGGEA